MECEINSVQSNGSTHSIGYQLSFADCESEIPKSDWQDVVKAA